MPEIDPITREIMQNALASAATKWQWHYTALPIQRSSGTVSTTPPPSVTLTAK